MSRRVDYFDDPNAPVANSLVPGGSALVVDDRGRILLQRRAADGKVRRVRQEFVVVFTAHAVGGTLTVSDKSTEVGWFDPSTFPNLHMHDSVRLPP